MSLQTKEPQIEFIEQTGGPTLGVSKDSRVGLLNQDGCLFKDLNKDGKLDQYEDWRLSPEERARDLASKLTIEQIAGLMLHSSQQPLPSQGWFGETYGGKSFPESGASAHDLTDQQLQFLSEDHVRHILMSKIESPATAAKWNNKLQSLCESLGCGIPVSISSDPRHSTDSSQEFNAGAGGAISMWPESLGLAATFDPEVTRRFAEVASIEYRALGITTALSPQIDLATDPRWKRFVMTFGEDSQLAADMARAFIDGLQTSHGDKEIGSGWGWESVNAMAKHWPGGGSGEGGRDAHFGYGKFAVYPGNNFEEHLVPFLEGAFRLDGPTGTAAAIMPYYTISCNQDRKYGENVGNSYSTYIISDLLRDKYGYNGVVCTDWGIVNDAPADIRRTYPGGKCWGVEDGYTVVERYYKLLMAGVDQIGGYQQAAPILEAYAIGVREHGEAFMRQRFERSAVRILTNMFRVGLFENPYLAPEKTTSVVGSAPFLQEGYEAQRKSVVLLKNEGNVLPLPLRTKVFIPKRYRPASFTWLGQPTPEKVCDPVNLDIVRKYFEIVDEPEEADAGLVFIESPYSTYGYSKPDADAGGNGYIPISLQYGAYTAEYAREVSLAGDSRDVVNRSYKGKTVAVTNSTDLDMVLDTKRRLGDKPVIVSLEMRNPTVMEQIEKEASAIVVSFGVQDQAILDILSGATEPSALLPVQLPANMKTVEEQYEDVPHDMEVYTDSQGNRYDFGFGMNWSGIIRDERLEKYKGRSK